MSMLSPGLSEPTEQQDPGNLQLGIPGFTYRDLHDPARLVNLLEAFDDTLQQADPPLFDEWLAYRAAEKGTLTPPQVSDLLVRVGPHVGRFVATLFGIEAQRDSQMAATGREFDALSTFRHAIVERVSKMFQPDDAAAWNVPRLNHDMELLIRQGFPELVDESDPERTVCLAGARLAHLAEAFPGKDKGSADPRAAAAELEGVRQRLASDGEAAERFSDPLSVDEPQEFGKRLLGYVYRWTYAALQDPTLRSTLKDWVSLREIGRVNFSRLVKFDAVNHESNPAVAVPEGHRRRRDGFTLTDKRFAEREVLFEVDHCIYCHDRERDSCSRGMRKKDGTLRENPLGVTLTGCPLEEKISEAHVLKRGGDNIAALALIAIDNPMVAGTGHRICNDCMKGCIYQKVEPVNIPQIETNILTDVLFMPYGFEIYDLLMRWNPLNVKRPCALPYHGNNTLIVGLGPAGYTLAHYLLNEGFAVVGIDALKIEPLPRELIGGPEGAPPPIRDFSDLYEDLDSRIMAGFGGVAEYGITVRWDKNFLKVIYLSLARRRGFRCYGGIRFGGTLSIDDAWEMGFHHIAIASGAGEPTVIGMRDNLIRGVRKASDFLMALQLTGAAKRSSMANLQVRLPAGVIGGGLTAIDTATELLAYYPLQVEKFVQRHDALVARYGDELIHSRYDDEELEILEEFLAHGRAVCAEREAARTEGREPDFLPLLNDWGGVTLYYRKGLEDSPAYRQNHEEIQKALEEGIIIAPMMSPRRAIPDDDGHLAAVKFDRMANEDGKWSASGHQEIIPLRSLFVAAGTSPNIIYEREHPGTFELDEQFFRRFEPQWNGSVPELVPMHDTALPKVGKPAPFTSYVMDGKYITFFGDNHPVYAGNVVKAMASAKDGYPYVVKLFEHAIGSVDETLQPERNAAMDAFFARLDSQLIATVAEVRRLAPTIVEVIVKAPMQARKFFPGQFYRVQNLESRAPVLEGTCLAAEGLALTGAWVDKDQGLISLITLEMGTSSKLCALWQPGEPVVVMGPTGAPTEIPRHQNVLLIGGGLGNAVLLSIGKAMREAGNQVIYFAGYRKPRDVFKVKELEEASDVLVWAVDPGPGSVDALPTTRPQDKSCVGNIIHAMEAYAKGELGPTEIPLRNIDHLVVIGSDRMMAAVKEARSGVLEPYLKPNHVAIGSINSPMQCMMKGVCAQCLCKHLDPETGDEHFEYSCFNQDQRLDEVDFPNLNARLRQNSVQEKLADLWLDYLLERHDPPRI